MYGNVERQYFPPLHSSISPLIQFFRLTPLQLRISPIVAQKSVLNKVVVRLGWDLPSHLQSSFLPGSENDPFAVAASQHHAPNPRSANQRARLRFHLSRGKRGVLWSTGLTWRPSCVVISVEPRKGATLLNLGLKRWTRATETGQWCSIIPRDVLWCLRWNEKWTFFCRTALCALRHGTWDS